MYGFLRGSRSTSRLGTLASTWLIPSLVMSPEELAEELHRRASHWNRKSSLLLQAPVVSVVKKYDLEITMDCFSNPALFVFKDTNNRSVGVYDCIVTDGAIRSFTEFLTNIAVIADGTMILGWLSSDQATKHDEGFNAITQSLRPMPKGRFDFAIPCPHLMVYGGIWRHGQSSWECFGCGEYLVDHGLQEA